MNCGECRTVCPVGLDPERLFKLHMARRDQESCMDRAADCYGCGCCEAVCPSRLPLSSAIQKSAIIGGSAC
jgi:electron transport complex protein RnfC